uniref:Uncharacterized protein n=1 Tax=Ditylenchus dipsaci TaxID=166011 RepID=A0A915DA09_9BILA
MKRLAPIFKGLDAFCGEIFWKSGTLQSPKLPLFSKCFQTRLLSAKLFTTWLMVIDSAFLFVLAFFQLLFSSQPVYPVDFVYPLLLCASMVVMAYFIVASQKNGRVTSAGIYLTWLLFAICGLPELYWWAKSDLRNLVDGIRFCAFLVWYMAVWVQIILFSFADVMQVQPDQAKNSNKKSPEKQSSFLSRQTMWWFNQICLIGIKKPLEVSDLYSLNSEDTSEVLVPKWNCLWDKAMKEYDGKKVNEPQSFNQRNPSFFDLHDDSLPLLAANIDHIDSSFQEMPRVEDLPKDTLEPPSVLFRLLWLFKWDLLCATVVKLFSDLLQFTNPQLLKALISFTSNPAAPLWHGVLLSISMFVSQLSSLFLNQLLSLTYSVGTGF